MILFYFTNFLYMFHFEMLNTPSSFNIDINVILNIFVQLEEIEHEHHSWTLNIVFVEDKIMQELNKKYRHIDAVTDVLSFHYYEDFYSLEKDDIAGEIILSKNKIISQWIEYALWSEKECYKLIIHSALHILWYDHEVNHDYEIMKKKEEQIWLSLSL